MRDFRPCAGDLDLTIHASHATIDEASQFCGYVRSDNIVDALCWSAFSATVGPPSRDVAAKTACNVFAKAWAESNGAMPDSFNDQTLRARSVD